MTQLCPHHDSIVSGEFPEINLCWKQISLLIFSPLDSSKATKWWWAFRCLCG